MRKLKLFLLTTFAILFAETGYSQTNMIWHFGQRAKLDFTTITTASPNPTATTTSELVTGEGSSGMTDLVGNDLFYTDGRTVWDKNGTKMPNSINSGGVGILKGHASSTSSAIVVPKPGSSTLFYIFTVSNTVDGGSDGYWYYVVDISLRGGLGDVVDGNGTLLYNNANPTNPLHTEKITLAKHGNGTDYWVIIAPKDGDPDLYAYQLGSTGIMNPTTPTISTVGDDQVRLGYIKINLTSTQIASTTTNGVSLYDFNSNTGAITNAQKISTYFYGYGVEFSPDGNTLYTSQLTYGGGPPSLYKYDLTASDIASTKATIATEANSGLYGAISLGPDKKIYVAHNSSNGYGQYVGVINDPDNFSTPNYNATQINFGSNVVFRGLPTFVPALLVPQCTNPTINDIVFSVTTNPICGKDFEMTVDYVKESGKTYNIQWYKGQNTSGTKLGTTETVKITDIGKTYYTVTVQDAGSPQCISTFTTSEEIILENIPVFEAKISHPDKACLNQDITISLEQKKLPTFVKWDITGNTGLEKTGVGEEIIGDVAYLYLKGTTTGLKNVRVFLESTEGCVSDVDSTISFTVNDLPSAVTIDGSRTICEGSTETYSINGGPTSGSTYSWTYQHKNLTQQGPFTGNTVSVDFTGAVNSPTTISVIETNSDGCSSASADTAQVIVEQKLNTQTFSGLNPVCEGSKETYTVNSPQIGSTYEWSYTHDGGSAIVTSGTSTEIDFTGVTTSPTVISLVRISPFGCRSKNDVSQTIVVNSRPTSAAFTGDNKACEGDNKVYTVTSPIGTNTYNWTYQHDGQSVSSISAGNTYSVNFTGITTSPTIVSLSVTNDKGCTSASSTDLSVTVNDRPSTTAFTGPSPICSGTSQDYVVTSPVGTSTYDWTYTHKNGSVNNVANTDKLTIDFTGVTNTPTKITLLETNSAGCTNSSAIELDVAVSQSPSNTTIVGVSKICEDNSSKFTVSGGVTSGSTYTWTYAHNGGSATTFVGDELTVVFPIGTTSTVITLEEENVAGCKSLSKATKTITVNPRPAITAFTGKDKVCEGEIVQYDITGGGVLGNTYDWIITHNDGTILNETGVSMNVDYTGINSSPTIISSTQTIVATGCTSKTAQTLSVTVNGRPNTTAFTGIDKICEGESATYTVTSPVGTSTYDWTYKHKNVALVNVSNQTSINIDFTGITATPTEIVLTETNAAGCTNSNISKLDVAVSTAPATVTISGVNEICEGDNGTFTIQGGNNATSTYTWTYQNNNNGNAVQTFVGYPLEIDFTDVTTTTDITLVEENAIGCKTVVAATKSVTINQRPNTTAFTGKSEVCEGDDVQYTVTSPILTSTYNWSYTHDGGSAVTKNNSTFLDIDFTSVTTSPTIISLSETNNKGCTSKNASQLSVTVNDRPSTTAFTGDSEVCEGDTEKYTVTNPSGTSTYDWSYTHKNLTKVDVANQTEIDIDFTGINATPTLISLLETNQAGCTNSATIDLSVKVNPRPGKVVIVGPTNDEICEGSSATFTIQGGTNSNSTYTWTYTHDGGSATTVTANSLTIDFTDVLTSPTIITVSETNTITGCTTKNSDIATKTIVVNQRPNTTAFTGKDQVCENETAKYTVTSPIGTSTYDWSYTHNGGSAITKTNSTFLDIDFTGIVNSPTVVVLTETNAKGCTNKNVSQLNVNVNSLSGVIKIAGDDEVCEGETVVYSIDGGANPSSKYNWTYTHKNQTQVVLNDQATLTIDFTGIANTPTAITVQEINSSGCASNKIANYSVVVNQRPGKSTIVGGPLNDEICEGNSATFNVQNPNANSTYTWVYTNNVVGSKTETGNSLTIDFTGVTTNTVITVSETNNTTGCSTDPTNLGTKTIKVNARPNTTAFTGDDKACEGDSKVYTVTNPIGTSTYAWTYTHNGGSAQTLPDGNSATIDFTGVTTTPTSIVLVETNAKGCTNSNVSSLDVIVNDRPNTTAFTGDNEVCEGETAKYTVTNPSGTSTYDWSYTHKNLAKVDIANQTEIDIDYTGINATPTLVSLLETNQAGCTNSATIDLSVKVNPRPTKSTIIGGPLNDEICEGGSATFNIQNINANSTYTWVYTNNVVGSKTETGNSLTIDFTGVTTNTVITVSETNNTTGCSTDPNNLGTKTIKVNSRPNTTAFTGDNAACEGDSKVYTVTNPTGTSTYSWTYTHNGGSAQTGTNVNNTTTIDFTGVTTSPTSIVLVETNEKGCKNSNVSSLDVSINDRPATIAITSPDSICENGSATFSVVQTLNSTYEWKVYLPSGTQTLSGNSINVDFLNIKNQFVNVEVVETNANGCKTEAASTTKIYIQSLPSQPSISGNTQFCLNNNGEFEAMNVNATSTFNWTYLGNPLAAKTKKITIPLTSVVTDGEITLTETTKELGCTSSTPASLKITVNDLPNITDITLPTTGICTNSEITVSVVGGSATSTYTWDLGTVSTTTVGATNQSSITFLLNGTSGNISVIETNTNNCSSGSAFTKLVTINSNPTTDVNAIVGDDKPQCGTTDVTYNVNNPATTSAFKWSVNPTVGLTTSDVTATNDQVVVAIVEKQLTLTVEETNQFGCSATIDDIVITPRSCGLVATISTKDTVICAGATGTYLDVSIQNDALVDVTNWKVMDATKTSTLHTQATGKQLDFQFTTAGTYYVVMDLTEDGVTKTDEVKVTVNPNPTLSAITAKDGKDKVCIQTINDFSVEDKGFKYVWTSSDATLISSSKNNASYDFGDVGGTVTVTAIDTSTSIYTQCQTQAVKTIELFNQPNKDIIEGDGTVCSDITTGNFGVKDPVATSTYAWKWLDPTYTANITTIGKGDNITIDFSTGQKNILSHKLLVSQTNTDGCTALTPDTLDVTVTLTPEKITGISVTGNSCDGDTKTLTANGGNGSYSYVWSSNKWNPTVDPNGFVTFTTDGSSTIDVSFNLTNATDTIAKFYVSQQNGACIGDSVDLDVTAHPNPKTIAFNSIDAVCSLAKETIAITPITGNTYDWYVGTNLLATNANSVEYTFADTAVTFRVIETNQFGCTTEHTKKIIVKDQPANFSVVAGNPLLCSDDSVLFTVSPILTSSTYDWSFTGNVSGVKNATTSGDSVYVFFSSSVNDSEKGTLVVKQTNTQTGCKTLDDDAVSFTFDITTTPLALDSITFAGNFLCDTDGDVFTAHGGKSQFEYLWSTTSSATNLVDAANKANIVNATFTLADSTKKLQSNIKVAQNNGGCIGDSINLNFDINTNPALVGFKNGDEVCSFTTNKLEVDRKNVNSTFDWYIKGNTTALAIDKDSISYKFTDKAVTFNVIETNEFGCTTEQEKTIGIKGQPGNFLVTSVTPLICSADSVVFTVSPITATSNYTWSFGGNVKEIKNATTSGDSVYVFFNTSGKDVDLGSVTVLQTDTQTGCTTLADSAVTYNFDITTTPLKLDSINFAGNFLCDTDGDVFTAHGGKAQFEYLWSTTSAATNLVDAANKANIVNATFTLADSTKSLQSNIKVAQNNGGCIGDTLNLDFTINTNPSLVEFKNDDEFCSYTTNKLEVIRTNTLSTFDWYVKGNTTALAIDKDSINYAFDKTAVTFNVIETNEFGCTTEQEKTIGIKGQPGNFLVTSITPLICSADSVVFTVSPITATSNYTWSFGGNVKEIKNATTSGDSVYVFFNTSGKDVDLGSVTVLQTDTQSGCTTLADSAVTYNFDITTTPLKLDSINFAGNFLCDTDGDVFTAHGGKAQFEYLWSTTSAATNLVDAANKANIVNATFTLADSTKSLQSNIKVAQNNGGCIGDTLNLDFTINTNPSLVEFNGVDKVCRFTTDTLAVVRTNTLSTFDWYIKGNSTALAIDKDSINYAFADTSITFNVIETNEFGCTTEQEKTIDMKFQPGKFSVVSGSPLVCSADSALFTVDPIVTNSTYDWTFAGNVTNVKNATTSGDSVYVFFDSSTQDFEKGKLTVKQTSDLGCKTLDKDATSFEFDITTTPEKLDSITFTGSKYICDGSTINFTAHGGKTHFGYVWNTDYTATTNLLNAADSINTVLARFTLQTQIDTLTNIKVAQDNKGCIGDSLTVDFTIQPNPDKVAFATEDSLCTQTSEIIRVTRADTSSVLSWKVGNFTIPNYSADSLRYSIITDVVFTVTETNSKGCVTTQTKSIIVKDQPKDFEILANKPLFCSTDTTILFYVDPKDHIDGTTYAWEYNGGISNVIFDTNNKDSVFVKFKNIALDTLPSSLVVKATNKQGCTTLIDDVIIKDFNVTKTPTKLSKIDFSGLFCDTEGGKFTAVGGNASYKYLWSTDFTATTTLDTSFHDNPIDVTFALNNTSDSLSNIKVAQNNGGCIGDTITEKITIHKNPSDVVIAGADSVCSFSTDQLFVIKNNSQATFDWSTTNFLDLAKDTISYKFADTSVTFTIVQKNQFGCTSEQQKTVHIKDQPDPFDVTSQALICSADSALFTINPIVATSSYEWSFDQGGVIKKVSSVNAANNQVYVHFDNDFALANGDSIETLLYVKQISDNGCKTLDEDKWKEKVNIITTPAPLDSITFDPFICNTGDKEFTAHGGKANYDFLWSTDFTTTTTVNTTKDVNTTVQFNLPTGDTLSNVKVAQNNTGCIGDTITLGVTVNPLPILPKIIGDDIVCIKHDSLIMTLEVDSAWQVTWGVVDRTLTDSSYVTRINTATDSTVMYIFNNFNSYTTPAEFFASVIDEKGCQSANSSKHSVNADISLQDLLDSTHVIIPLDSAHICDVADSRYAWEFMFNPNISKKIDSYNWKIFANPNEFSTGTTSIQEWKNDSTIIRIEGSEGSEGHFILEVNPQNKNCKNQPKAIQLPIFVEKSKDVSFIIPDRPTCLTDANMFHADVVVTNLGTFDQQKDEDYFKNNINYSWNYHNIDTLATTDTSGVKFKDNLNLNALANNDTIYYQNANGVQKGDSLSLKINANYCARYDGVTKDILWNQTKVLTVIDYPVADIDITAVGAQQEDLIDKVTINDDGYFVIDDVISLQLAGKDLEKNDATYEYTYNWSYFNPEVDSAENKLLKNHDQIISLYQNPLELKETKIYLEVAYKEGYCKYLDSAIVLNNFVTFIPNVFSPNGDGTFDTWVIRNIDKHPEATGQIFNRWGALVYEGPMTTEGWKGQTNDDKDLPMGTYFYIVKYSADSQALAGSVTIMR